MATRLEILLSTIFDNSGVSEALSSIREIVSSTDELTGATADIAPDIAPTITPQIDDSEIVATRDQITEYANLAPVVPLMIDNSEGVESIEAMRLDASQQVITPLGADTSPFIASDEEIRALARIPSITPMYGDASGIMATDAEIRANVSEPIITTMRMDTSTLADVEDELARLRELASGDLPPPPDPSTSITGVRNLANAYENMAEEARNAARAAANIGDEEEVQKQTKLANAYKATAGSMRRLSDASRLEIQALSASGKTISGRIRLIDSRIKAEKKLAAALVEVNQREKAQVHMERIAALKKEKAALKSLTEENREFAQVTRTVDDEISDRFTDVHNLKDFEARVKEIREEFKLLKNEALATTDNLDALMEVAEKDQALKRMSEAALGSKRTFKLFGEELGFLERIMTSSFNQLGFVMFVTQNTIRSLINAVNGLKEAMQGAMDTAAQWRATMLLTGRSANSLNIELLNASRGMLNIKEASNEAVYFMARMGDEGGALVNTSAELATSLGILGGATPEQVTQGFKDILNTMLELNGGMIRIGNATADFSEAQRKVALAEQEFGEMLPSEKLAIYIDELERMEAQYAASTEGMAPMNATLNETSQAATNSWDKIKVFVGGISDAFIKASKGGVETMGNLARALTSVSDKAWTFVRALATLGTIPGFGAIVQLIELIRYDLDQALLNAIDRIDFFFSLIPSSAVATASAMSELVRSFKDLGDIISSVGEMSRLFFAFDFDGLKTEFENFKELVIVEAEDIANAFKDGWDAGFARGDELFDPLREALGGISNEIGDSLDIPPPKFDFSSALENLGIILDGTYDLQVDQQKAWEEYNDEVIKINKERDQELRELQNEHNKAILEAQEKFDEDFLELGEDLNDKVVDINDKLALSERRTREDAEDNREKARRKHNKKMEDIEETHQKKLRDIMRKFDLARLKALIDRDARALYEAERRRDEDLQKEHEANEDKKQDELDSIKERIDDIDAAEQKKLERMREDAQIRRQAAIDDYQDRLNDLRDALDDEKETLEEALIEQRSEIKKSAEIAAKDRKKEWKKRVKQLKDDYAEQERIGELSRLRDTARQLQIMQDHGDDISTEYAAWLADYEQMMIEHNRITEQFTYPGSGGTGLITEPPPPPNTTEPTDNCVPNADIKYNPGPETGIYNCSNAIQGSPVVACNGSVWTCDNGVWVPYSSYTGNQVEADTSPTTASVSRSGGGGMLSNIGGNEIATGQNGQVPVTIVVQGDQTLEQIFSEIAYTAYINILT